MKQKRKLRPGRVLLVLVLIGALLMLALFGAVCWRARAHLRAAESGALEPADCVIVLGARVYPDGRMSRVLRTRVDAALSAWRAGSADALIVCGARGRDEPRSEAAAMAEYLRAQGVPEARLLLDESSFDTRQNINNARALMEERGWTKALVVTSDYHVERALWMARDAGIEARGLAAATPHTFRAYWWGRIRETISWVLYAVRAL